MLLATEARKGRLTLTQRRKEAMALQTARQQKNHFPVNRDTEQAWWARGDAPVRVAETLIPLVDGRAAMLAMVVACLTAKNHIWLVDWDLHAELELVRGRDQRAGEPGTPEQEMLLERLRAEGLDEEAVTFWQQGRLRVLDVFSFAARRGVDVRVL